MQFKPKILCANIAFLSFLMFNHPANAETSDRSSVFSSAYKKSDQILVVSVGGPYDNPYPVALDRIIDMTDEKEFSRFALFKNRCSQIVVNNSPRNSFCKLQAKMLRDGEIFNIKKKEIVRYFRIYKDSTDGLIAKQE
jgi:hypothetical protein